MENLTERILELKEKSKTLEAEKMKLTGELEVYEENLKEFECEDLDQAEQLLEKIANETNKLEEELKEILEDLEENLNEFE